ncbi:hypothetical protein AB0I98_35690 [Streptomyces sp. NPDC050211]|uniref:hypothetical protein n=1 Tax=Streptomyces sp. NPDC050211 TaxID=3154932 RepID=UPI00344921C2
MYPGLHRSSLASVLSIYRETLGWTVGYVIADGVPGFPPDEQTITPLIDATLFEFEGRQGPVIAANCACFDAVSMPSPVGQALLTAGEGGPHVPALVDREASRVVLLVEPGSGSALASNDERMHLHAGLRSWITVPPSPGLRWDTPPWIQASRQPAPLPCGQDLVVTLHKVQRVLKRSGV